ncbi:hypothetical protein BJ981_007350 [Sphaerisporangium krabiense]|uniref:Uncharacterized protein n=1 Tax=Sphaerisporangium krabiense TaxID=763782 RepID=A0A7W8ZCN6_9ACTN|nr:hypothetical protein [Sphaerisporangium krabiense]
MSAIGHHSTAIMKRPHAEAAGRMTSARRTFAHESR